MTYNSNHTIYFEEFSEWYIGRGAQEGYWAFVSSPKALSAFGLVHYAPFIQSFLVTLALYLYVTVFTLQLPVYFRRRALPFLESSCTCAQEELGEIWTKIFLPITENWKGIMVLSALTSSAIFGMFQASPTLSQDSLALSIAYFTLMGAMVSVLTSTALLLHVSGRQCDERFLLTWVEEMKNCSAMSVWNIWTVLSLPSVWTAWSSVGFVTVVALQIWKDPDVQTHLSSAAGPFGHIASSTNNPNKPFSIFAVGLSAMLGIGLLQILGMFATFWSIGTRPQKQGDQELQSLPEIEPIGAAIHSDPSMGHRGVTT
ncbi:hypothetical protein DFP72DRAFT_483545 [Ephemerocybe angulata]|uniref:Uncharacterized protein n=1 Tax=Ephemerocybe angulata TaxID=980116 RepID=A0A8H6IDZ5_9AGAR|nr:hypothetical protein DFP72DRAFT_483545 [Tulosesus angulatus]